MYVRMLMTVGLVLGLSATAFGQAADTPYQVRFAFKLKGSDLMHVSNSGASSTVAAPVQNGALCANIYAMAADTGLMLNCCACKVPPNALRSISIENDVLEGAKPRPKAVGLKIMASTGVAGVCNAGTVGTGANVLVTGLTAWKAELPFTPSTLSAAELVHLNAQCLALHADPRTCESCP